VRRSRYRPSVPLLDRADTSQPATTRVKTSATPSGASNLKPGHRALATDELRKYRCGLLDAESRLPESSIPQARRRDPAVARETRLGGTAAVRTGPGPEHSRVPWRATPRPMSPGGSPRGHDTQGESQPGKTLARPRRLRLGRCRRSQSPNKDSSPRSVRVTDGAAAPALAGRRRHGSHQLGSELRLVDARPGFRPPRGEDRRA
jgi:hypothetical protein